MNPFDLATLAVTPWKNGGGATREIVCQPAGAGMDDFDWRVSVATVAASGPFSTFPGIDRVIVLLSGDGACLKGAGMDRRLDTPLEPFAFSGDSAMACELLGGASTDFNVMTRRSGWRAELRVLHAAGDVAGAPGGVLFAIGGAWDCTTASDRAFRLCADSGLWWHGAPEAWRVMPTEAGATLLAVRIEPNPEGARR